MKEKKVILKKDGKENEYTLLKLHKSNRLKKYYILYTDETYDSDDKLNIFVSRFNKRNNTINDLETDDEWNEMEVILEEYINGI